MKIHAEASAYSCLAHRSFRDQLWIHAVPPQLFGASENHTDAAVATQERIMRRNRGTDLA
jgi:hypothetical protein